MIPDLDRRWTVAEATSLLWTQGISLRLQADGYHLVDVRPGADQPKQITDDLIEALVLGCAMAEHTPTVPPKQPRRPRRLITRKAKIKSHNRARLRRALRHLRPRPK